MPTLIEQLYKLCLAKCFSLVDVREGFLHIPLGEEPSRMARMHTSFGQYQWQSLSFGITSAPKEFQMQHIAALEGLADTTCIVDNILVFGEGKDFIEAEQDHDCHFVTLMEHCLKESIKLNPIKLQFKLPEVKFMGNIITRHGMKADPDKFAAITTMPTPRNSQLPTVPWHGQVPIAILPKPEYHHQTPYSPHPKEHPILLVNGPR